MLSLLDSSREYYLLKEKGWDLGYGEIFDSDGNVIGKMNRRLRNIRGLTKLTEVDGTGILKIQRKFLTPRITYDIFESHEDDGKHGMQFARCCRAFTSIIRPKMWLNYDPDKNNKPTKRLDAQGSFAGWNFKVISDGKAIAEVKKLDRFRDLLGPKFLDIADTHAIHILDKDFDRKILLGFIMCIERSLNTKK
tara:strand:+ start:1236 stop:1814 length:579 start_codon:yes stop_codon:yes gene_type:complete